MVTHETARFPVLSSSDRPLHALTQTPTSSSRIPQALRALPGRYCISPSKLLKKAFSTACALTLVSPEAGEKIRKEASFTQGVESLRIAILGFPGVFQHPCMLTIW